MRIAWLTGWRSALRNVPPRRVATRKRGPKLVRHVCFEALEDRRLLAIDYGDAPDTSRGTGAGNYQTLSSDGGPRHTILAGLMLGAAVDGENGSLQNAAANADDFSGAPDDEDGVIDPAFDLTLTKGTQPTIAVRVTNTTSRPATLYGWIDYNADGVFDNANERAAVPVPVGTDKGIVTLTFPAISLSAPVGTSYARFRLSTANAAANPIGAASDGEVEDYRVSITKPGDGRARSSFKIASNTGGGPTLANLDRFGGSVASLGDLDGDGITDLAVGVYNEDTGGANRGAVKVLFLNTDGSVKSFRKIAHTAAPDIGPTLANSDYFGRSVASLGDLDGDGVTDLAVGADGDDTDGSARGAVHLLFLNSDGSVKSVRKIVHNMDSDIGPTLANFDRFGTSVSALGDLDGDGLSELAVGAYGDDTGGNARGAVHVLFLNREGITDPEADILKSSLKIASGVQGGPALTNFDFFGRAITALGDLDGDGVTDLAVGAQGDDTGGTNRGAVHVLFLNVDGSVKNFQKITHNTNPTVGPTLANSDYFGSSISALSDLDGDGVTDLAVGAYGDDTGGALPGAIHVLMLNAAGSVKRSVKIASNTNGGPTLGNGDRFGSAISSLGDLDGDGVIDLAVGASRDDTEGTDRGAVYILFMSEIPTDFGDAPDGALGTGRGNYETLLGDNGPNHLVVPSLRLTASVDGDSGGLQNVAANADDVDSALPDDEDGVVHPASDLTFTVGTHPTMAVRVTNLRGAPATLYGWIDYDANGDFSNASERAAIVVPDGTSNELITLTFPVIPLNSRVGTTYARLRLSTDDAAANPTGAARDGEVEDYRITITRPGDGSVGSSLKIASNTNGGPSLINGDRFGGSVASLGDLDGDGVTDLAVGADGDNTGGSDRGAVRVLFLNADGSVKNSLKIGHLTNGGPALKNADRFGRSVASLGDLDGDGVTDLAVGAEADDYGGTNRGAVYILFLNPDGSVKSSRKIASDWSGGPTLVNADYFGRSVASLGDLDGDGVTDLAVGATGDDTSGGGHGAVHMLFLRTDGSVRSSLKLNNDNTVGPMLRNSDRFGDSITSLGDLDGDGVTEMAVGAYGDDTGGTNRGAVHLLFLRDNGSVKSSLKIANGLNGGPTLADNDRLGRAVTLLGDLDGDGVADLAVGAEADDTGGSDRGALYVLKLNANGTVKNSLKIASNVSGGPALANGDRFGRAVTVLGDLNRDGVPDLAVGAPQDDTGGADRGAVHILFSTAIDFGDAPDAGSGTGPGNYQTQLSDDGPRHTISSGLLMTAAVDGDGGAQQNVAANADDVDSALPDDEDGVVHTASDLALTVGTQPTMAVRVTNLTGAPATLYGWIDYDANGVFSNASERAAVVVPDGTSNEIFTLPFPTIPSSTPAGTTYARLRLSTDDAAANPTGAARDGEVEDYRISITRPGDGSVNSSLKIASGTGGGPSLFNSDRFGGSVASLGDLDGDGVPDLAVGAYGDDTGGPDRGAVSVLLLHADGSVKSSVKIGHNTNVGPLLGNSDRFGRSLASLGDLDGDGVIDLAVGAEGDDTGGANRGAVHVLFLNPNGSVKSSRKIASGLSGGPTLMDADYFGRSVASLGDLDGDGVTDLAVGATGDDTSGGGHGALHVLFLKTDGSVRSSLKLNNNNVVGPRLANGDRFGDSVASLGDLDGDGVTELAVGAYGDDTGGANRGAVHMLFLRDNGSVKSSLKIASGLNGGPVLLNNDRFGRSVTLLGDLDGDGVADLAVGAEADDTGGVDRGALHVLLLNAAGTVKSALRIDSNTSGVPVLANNDRFGRAVTALGDLNGDGVPDLAVGAPADDTGGMDRGAVHVLFLRQAGSSADLNDARDYGFLAVDCVLAASVSKTAASGFGFTGDSRFDFAKRDALLVKSGGVRSVAQHLNPKHVDHLFSAAGTLDRGPAKVRMPDGLQRKARDGRDTREGRDIRDKRDTRDGGDFFPRSRAF